METIFIWGHRSTIKLIVDKSQLVSNLSHTMDIIGLEVPKVS